MIIAQEKRGGKNQVRGSRDDHSGNEGGINVCFRGRENC